jgi:hypothetical protein
LADPFQQYLDLEAGAEYDTNPNMDSEDEKSVWLGIVKPGYRLQWKQDENELRAEADLRIERSSDTDLSDDREDPSLSLQWLRLNPRGETRVLAFYSEESTRITEFDDTGRLSADGTRTDMGLEAGWDHSITERSQLSLMGRYDDISYDGGDFTDYELTSSILNYSYLWHDNTVPYLQLQASSYQPDGSLSENSELYGFVLGLQFPVGTNFAMDVSGGEVWVDAEESDSNWNGRAALAYLGERTRWDIEYTRTTTASGAGGFEGADGARVALSYDYSELTTFGGSAQWRKNRSDELNESAYAELWASRQLEEYWKLRFSWKFRQQKGNAQRESEGHAVSVYLEYTIPYRT